MHGTAKGLGIAQTGELAPWGEIIPRFRSINVASRGNLCVIAGVCFSFNALKLLSITAPSPVNMFIGPVDVVSAGFLEDGLIPFYKSIFEAGDISDAQAQFLGEPFHVFNAERFFVIAFCRHIKESCRGKGATSRRERLLTEFLQANPNASATDRKEARKKIKAVITPDQSMVDRYAEVFLLGRPSPFPLEQLMGFVDNARKLNFSASASSPP